MPIRSVRCALKTAAATLAFAGAPLFAQQDPGPKGKAPGPTRPDEFKAMVKEVQEAYKAPFEVDKDIRDELRKQYQNPTPEREQKILRETRRLYTTTPEQEERILGEMRRAYEVQSPDQEARVFSEIRRLGQLPPGTVPMSQQSSQAEKLFQKLDVNRDGVLSSDELPDGLAATLAQWDANRDGVIEPREYWVYYQSSLKTVSEKVASGEISIKLPKGATLPVPPPTAEEPMLRVYRAGKLPAGLPDWFAQLDTDADGQVGLYEWRAAGRNVDAFAAMDQNGDGLLTAEECLKWLKMSAAERAKAELSTRSAPRVGVPPAKTGKPLPAGVAKPGKTVVKPGPGGEPVLIVKPAKGEDKMKPKPPPGEKKK